MRLALATALLLAAPAAADIAGARYDGPTTRYAHGILGDAVEHDTLTVTLTDGRRLSAHWPDTIVFEDTAPRLADLDGDGDPEVIVVESHAGLGSRLAIWGLRDGRLTALAATPYIGQRFRWLAPVGAADLDGDGRVEIAYVETPHRDKVLRVWRYARDGDASTLTPVASLRGVTNHRIGDRAIAGGIRACGGRRAMILADADWSRVVSVTLDGGSLTATDVGPLRGPGSVAAGLRC
jgi:hypothetical protein